VEPLLPDDPDRIGPNELLARLGAGGMGQVYLARTRGGRPVAVKVIHEQLAADRDFRARFGREVAAARRVTGAFTAPLLDADPEAALPWLATAYLPGLSLDDAVAGHGPLPVAAVRALGAALAEALVAVHAAGVVHRDLKPPNVLLTSAGPRVIDFGIARAADFATLTGTGVIIGTPGYLAPEQITGAEAGAPVDVFALGALLVHALTGVGPFGRGSSHDLLLRTVTAEPSLDGVADAVLRAQLAACLDKAPERRPAPDRLVAEWSTAGPAPALDGTRWLPAPVAEAIDRAAAALPRLLAAPWRAAPAAAPPPQPGAAPTSTWPPPAPRRRRLSRRTLLGGAVAAGVLGTTAALVADGAFGPGAVRWRVPSDQAWLSRGPWLVGGVLLAEDAENRLESRDPADGALRWTSTVRVRSQMAMDAVDGVGVGLPGGFGDGVVGLDLATGERLWQRPIEAPSSSPSAPVGAAGRVLLVGYEDDDRGAVAACAFGARDGVPLWRVGLAGTTAHGVAVDGDVACTADDEGYAYGIDVASGAVRWRVRLSEEIGYGLHSRPVAAGGRVFVANRDALFALDAATGRTLWTLPVEEGVGEAAAPLVVDDRIYLAAVGEALYALAAADGAVAWKAPVDSGRPLPAGPVAGLTTPDGLVGVALDTGRTLWERPAGRADPEPPVLAGGLFHVADEGVVSLDPATGAVVRTVGEDDGVDNAQGLGSDGSALYLAVGIVDSALCSLTLPAPPA
jgi:eukaryotic-like serine/threonine-protein kinase